MNSYTRQVLILAAVVILAIPVVVSAQRGGRPELRSADDRIEAPRPDGRQEIALLDVVLEAKQGRAVKASVERPSIINGFAPKDLARSGGGWTIRLEGERELEYNVNNPLLDVELERDEDDGRSKGEPFGYVVVEGRFVWELTVPLYQGETSLGVKAITVLDEEKETVFSIEVDRDTWARE